MPAPAQQRSLTSFFAPKTTPKSATATATTERTASQNMSSNKAKNGTTAPAASAAGTKRAIENSSRGSDGRAAKSPKSGGAGDTGKRSKMQAADTCDTGAVVANPVESPIGESGWATALAKETSKPYFQRLQAFLDREYGSKPNLVYPPRHQLYSAFESCPLADVKVVILGQDPYHGPGQAHGLSFSVGKGIPQPPSLRNMIKEAVSCCGIKPTKSGTLTSWSRQGVLLLNSVLSVQKAKPFSHQKQGWEQFTDAVIRELNKGDRRLVFMLWGKPSQKKGGFIDSAKHRVLKCAHPSPLSATKGSDPFIGSRCFAKANEALEELGHDSVVDWNVED